MKVAQAGMALSFVLFTLSAVVLFTSIQGERAWLVLLFSSLLAGLAVSFFSPTSKDNGSLFGISCGIFILLVLISLDMQDEAVNAYPGGFEAGNGFLLDGLAQLAYVPAMPLLFLIGLVLQIFNIRRKRDINIVSKRAKGKVR